MIMDLELIFIVKCHVEYELWYLSPPKIPKNASVYGSKLAFPASNLLIEPRIFQNRNDFRFSIKMYFLWLFQAINEFSIEKR